MFEELTFRNFLSFGPDAEPVRLGRLNVLVGPNGSGKSNFLDGIGLLAGCPLLGAWGKTLAEGGGVDEWVHHEADPRTVSLEAVVRLSEDKPILGLRHQITIQAVQRRHHFIDERVERDQSLPGKSKPYFFFGYENGIPTVNQVEGAESRSRGLRRETVKVDDSILAQFSDPDQYPELSRLAGFYRTVRLYRDWTFGRRSAIRRPGATDADASTLAPDAGNLAMVINGLKPSARQRIAERLQDILASFRNLGTRVEASTIQILLLEGAGEHEVSALRLSDGTLRYLAMLVMFLHPNPPPVTIVEEPELGLHPDLLPGVARLMVEASTRTQIIATSHSDIIIDELTDHAEAIRVCDKDEGSTSIRPIDPESLDHWLKEYGLGQTWLRGGIGGKRW